MAGALVFGVAFGQPTTLTIGRPADALSINPFRHADNPTSEVTYQIHEGLVTFTPESELVPQLAESWELLDDGLTWRFHLRQGVSFHSGAPFDAEAARWSFETMLNPASPGVGAGLFPRVTGYTVVDAYTLDVTLAQPNGVFVSLLGSPLLMMVDPARYESLGPDRYGDNPSGTGPFRFVSWNQGAQIVLERNDDYWGGAPAIERVEFVVISDPSARILALLTGEIDLAFRVPAEQMPRLETTAGFQVYRVPSTRTVWIGVNSAHPFLTKNVRYALAHAIDRDQIIAIIGDDGVPAYALGPQDMLGYEDISLPRDVERAAALLDEEGWARGADGFRYKDGERLALDLIVRGVVAGEVQAVQVVQLQLRRLGVDITINQVEGGAYNATLNGGATQYFADGTIPSYHLWTFDAGIRTGEFGYILGRPLCHQTTRNWEIVPCTTAYDEAFALSQSTAPLEERLTGYRVMGDIFREEQYRIPLFHVQTNAAGTARLQNFELNPDDSLDLRTVSFSN